MKRANLNDIYDVIAGQLNLKEIPTVTPSAHEYEYNGVRVALKYSRGTYSVVHITYKMLSRIDALLLALESQRDEYDLFLIDAQIIESNMNRQDARIPPFGIINKEVIRAKGSFIQRVSI